MRRVSGTDGRGVEVFARGVRSGAQTTRSRTRPERRYSTGTRGRGDNLFRVRNESVKGIQEVSIGHLVEAGRGEVSRMSCECERHMQPRMRGRKLRTRNPKSVEEGQEK